MIKKLKIFIILLPLFFTAFSSTEQIKSIEYYNNLQSLKLPHSPYEMKIIKTENLGKEKSVVESGILLTYKNRYAGNIKIAGDFSNWKPVDMFRGKYGVWYYFLTDLYEKKMIRYKFIADGIWILDPMNTERENDDSGSYVSVLYPLCQKDNNKLTYRFIEPYQVEFRIFKPKAKFVSIVGDFNNWNPENDLLEKDKSGVWNLQKRLSPGLYKYKYIVDGDWILDLYNEKTAGDEAEGICSLLKIE